MTGRPRGLNIVLDARTIPHAIRHADVFGAIDAVVPGFARNVIEPHDPVTS
ncbi:DUF2249 domain-containing protein [Cryobacterium sp. Y57]|uniref:DUF2249 domain-containing protein n=1 Tax=Cryobacterium sp. Y57 TaxID=2048287 RepID=UPI0011B0A28D|nr:DUF2249 domain-containing protein [Cryobacterium sp. Y57]